MTSRSEARAAKQTAKELEKLRNATVKVAGQRYVHRTVGASGHCPACGPLHANVSVMVPVGGSAEGVAWHTCVHVENAIRMTGTVSA